MNVRFLLAATAAALLSVTSSGSARAAATVRLNVQGHVTITDSVDSGRVAIEDSRGAVVSPVRTWSSIATASADDRRGRIGASAQLWVNGDNGGNWVPQVSAGGRLDDTLTFFGPEPAIVTLTLSLFGSMSDAGIGATSRLAAYGYLTFGWLDHASIGVEWFSNEDTVRLSTSGDVDKLIDDPWRVAGTMTVSGLVNPGDTIDVVAEMGVHLWRTGSYGQPQANFGHTAWLSIDLPDGMSYTSASGGFLNEVQRQAVPEPASWALGLAGLAAAAWRRRRQATDRRAAVGD